MGLALRIGGAYGPGLWEDAFKFLATTRTEEVMNFFVDFLVRHESQYLTLEKIAVEYLASG